MKGRIKAERELYPEYEKITSLQCWTRSQRRNDDNRAHKNLLFIDTWTLQCEQRGFLACA